jgi:hypothetical protein
MPFLKVIFIIHILFIIYSYYQLLTLFLKYRNRKYTLSELWNLFITNKGMK